MQIKIILLSVLLLSQVIARAGEPVHDINYMNFTKDLDKQDTIHWIVKLHKKNESYKDRGFRSHIKAFKNDFVGSEHIQMVSDLSEPLRNKQKLPAFSPIHDLVVLNASHAAIQSLLSQGKIISAEPDRKYELQSSVGVRRYHLPPFIDTPYFKPYSTNDPLWVDQWGLQQTQFNEVKQNYPVSVSQTANRVLIFVIDTWVDATHEDLISNTFINSQGPFDGTGLPSYHGSHVSGIMAATNSNGKGIAGALDNASIVPLEVCDNNDYCDESKIIQAIYFTADGLPGNHLPRVVNMSLGAATFSYQTFAAIKYAQSKDVLFVAAAGNSAAPALAFYPASYPDVISVGASTQDYNIAYFSNFGANSLTILAPGQSIVSTIPRESANPSDPYAPVLIDNSPYAYLDGTSMATPFVTAAAALVRANNPSLPQYLVRQVLQQSAQNLSINTHAPGEVYKLLNAAGALQMGLQTTWNGSRAANNNIASATLDTDPTKSCYVSYNISKPCQNCILVHGNVGHLDSPKTRIRWMVFQLIPTEPQPWWTTAVSSDGSFDDQISYQLPQYDNDGSRILNNYNFLVGFIEDRDASGEIRDLIPLNYSNGENQFDIGNTLCAGNATH